LDVLERQRDGMPNGDNARADEIMRRRHDLAAAVRRLAQAGERSPTSRIHGDFHLGQVLIVTGDAYIIDFEGEPARPLEERRRKQSPLKDVVGMMRSFSYAAYAAMDRVQAAGGEKSSDDGAMADWVQLWQHAATAKFLNSYRETMAASSSLLPPPADAQVLLGAYLLEKALCELQYELNNRPTWAHIPINSILVL